LAKYVIWMSTFSAPSSEYESSGLESVFKPGIMAEGSRNVLVSGSGKPRGILGHGTLAGKVGGRFMTNAGDSYASLGAYGDASGKGSVVRVMAGLFFCGTGALYYDGASLSATASSVLQLKLLASAAFGTTYQAGLSQPSAPTIATRTSLGVGMSGKLKAGTYTVKVYKIRTATGCRSNASVASNVVIAAESNNIGQSLRVTLPAADTNGGDRWGICVTPEELRHDRAIFSIARGRGLGTYDHRQRTAFGRDRMGRRRSG
jgi:hypothetical protein